MKIKLTIIILTTTIISSISSCQNKDVNPIKDKVLTKGHLIYEHKLMGVPFEFDFKFNKENIRINEHFLLNNAVTKIINKNTGEVLHLDKRSDTVAHFNFTSIERMIALQRGSAYGDTIITKTKEFKNILGYNCNKTIMKLGSQVEVILWTTDKIKTGITFPNTPLTLNDVALEYEMKILGDTRSYYKIKSIKEIPENDKDLEQNIPDEYKLIVPFAIYSLNPNSSKNTFKENLKSFEYPTFKGGNEEVKKYFDKVFSKLETNEKTTYYFSFTINKSGNTKNLKVLGRNKKTKTLIQNELINIPQWIPGKVNGKNVNSELTIFYR